MCRRSTTTPSLASVTGILVVRVRISSNALLWLGSRCWRKTKAIPVESGKVVSMAVKASRPPADAPTPTTGKSLSIGKRSEAAGEVCDPAGRLFRFGVEDFFTGDTPHKSENSHPVQE